MTEQARIRQELAAQYDLVTDILRIGGICLEVTRLSDPDVLLDETTLLASPEDVAWQPYWAQAWEAAIGLSWELATRDLAGKRVLDLGCGLGISGTMAAALGAEVMLADYAPPALDFAKYNSWPWRERVEIRHVDWRTDRLGSEFDLILGADILYHWDDLPHLDRFWRSHLTSGGTLLLADPNRPLTTQLLKELREQGWNWQCQTRRIEGISREIRLAEMVA